MYGRLGQWRCVAGELRRCGCEHQDSDASTLQLEVPRSGGNTQYRPLCLLCMVIDFEAL